MKTHLVGLFSLMFFLSGCVTAPLSTPFPAVDATQVSTITPPNKSIATAAILPASTVTPPTSTTTPYPSTPTFISAPLPSDLIVAYVVEDELWIWKQNSSRLLMRRQNISAPVLSHDGQWILFRQRHIRFDEGAPLDELWVMRTDGSELQRLVESSDLLAIAEGEIAPLINDIGWLPGRHEILFNTKKIIEGPPESWPVFDLYSLDLSGNVTRLAEPELGGNFIPSPDGLYVALVTDSRIGLLELESGRQRTLLEFAPLLLGCECLYTPEVVWDPQSQFVVSSIPPQNLHYPEKYHGEPEKAWRLSVDGQVELVTQWLPIARVSGIAPAPSLQYFLYLHNSCSDAMGMLYVYNIASAEEYPLTCVWELPQWAPDGEHFIYKHEGLWQLGSILSVANQPLDFLNVPTAPNVHASPQLTWMNDEYFLLVLRSRDACTLSVATLQGIVTEIASTPPDVCPRRLDFSLPK